LGVQQNLRPRRLLPGRTNVAAQPRFAGPFLIWRRRRRGHSPDSKE
jgi:hypothetical protein